MLTGKEPTDRRGQLRFTLADGAEVTGFLVPDTDGLFVVFEIPKERRFNRLLPSWRLAHVPSRFNVVVEVLTRKDGENVARQLYDADPSPWRRTNPQEVTDATAPGTGRWLSLIWRGAFGGKPVANVKPYAEFIRDEVAL
jgi:hypothetical protein